MTEKEIAFEIVKHLGGEKWKYKRGFGGGNHYFFDEPPTNYVLVSVDFFQNQFKCSANATIVLDDLNPHYRWVTRCKAGGDPHTHLSNTLFLRVAINGKPELEQIEQFKAAVQAARDFFETFTSVEAANAEIERLLADEPDLESALYDRIRLFVGHRFLVLAIKYEAKAPDLDEFIAKVKQLDWVNKDWDCKTWIAAYEAGELEQRLDEFRTASVPAEQSTALMKDHGLHAKPAVCGFVFEKKLSPEQFCDALEITHQKTSEVELTESVVNYRGGSDPWDFDLFDFGKGMLCITSNEAVSDLNFEKASAENKIITFRAIEPSAMWSMEKLADGESVSMRVDHNGKTMKTGTDLLPNCAEGSMDLFSIFEVIESELGADFWQLPQEFAGTRLSKK